jgi:hypothetical protein
MKRFMVDIFTATSKYGYEDDNVPIPVNTESYRNLKGKLDLIYDIPHLLLVF